MTFQWSQSIGMDEIHVAIAWFCVQPISFCHLHFFENEKLVQFTVKTNWCTRSTTTKYTQNSVCVCSNLSFNGNEIVSAPLSEHFCWCTQNIRKSTQHSIAHPIVWWYLYVYNKCVFEIQLVSAIGGCGGHFSLCIGSVLSFDVKALFDLIAKFWWWWINSHHIKFI